jgi:hypothetical protein
MNNEEEEFYVDLITVILLTIIGIGLVIGGIIHIFGPKDYNRYESNYAIVIDDRKYLANSIKEIGNCVEFESKLTGISHKVCGNYTITYRQKSGENE